MSSFWDWLKRLLGGGAGQGEKYVVAVDPGHGGKFSGAAVPDPDHPGQQVLEKDLTLQIGLKLGQLLERDGHRVIYTRKGDQNLADELNADLRERAEIANNAGAEVFVSIHCNSSENPAAEGIEVYHFPNSASGQALATALHDKLMQKFPHRKDRGVKAENFAVLRLTTMPAALVETEFLTHPESLEFLRRPENQTAIAEALRDGIYDYFA